MRQGLLILAIGCTMAVQAQKAPVYETSAKDEIAALRVDSIRILHLKLTSFWIDGDDIVQCYHIVARNDINQLSLLGLYNGIEGFW